MAWFPKNKDLDQISASGSGDDPKYAEEWAVTSFIVESMLNDIAEMVEPEKPQLLKVLNHANDHAVFQALLK